MVILTRNSGTLRDSNILRETACWREVKGTVVPLRSETEVGWILAGGENAAGAEDGATTGAATAVGAGAARPPLAASTSAAVMRPLGPDPPMVERSTPISLASFFA